MQIRQLIIIQNFLTEIMLFETIFISLFNRVINNYKIHNKKIKITWGAALSPAHKMSSNHNYNLEN
jgi:hypothetical protein